MRVSVQNGVSGALRTLANVPYAGADAGFEVVSGASGVVVYAADG